MGNSFTQPNVAKAGQGCTRCSVLNNRSTYSDILQTIMSLWHSNYYVATDFNEEQFRVRQIRCLAILIAFNELVLQKFVTVALVSR